MTLYTAKNDQAIAAVRDGDNAILDVGCGTGETAKEIRERLPGARLVGINFSQAELNLAKQNLDRAEQLDLNYFVASDLDEKFDLIICSHVVEHLIDPKTLLQEFASLLTPRGRIVVLVPNFGVWTARIKVLFGRFEYQDHGLYDRTHLRFFTYYTFAKEVVPESLQLSENFEDGHFPLPVIRRIVPETILNKIDAFALRLFPNLFAVELGLILTAKKPPC